MLTITERTKLWIADATRKLLEKKPIESLSVADICREADIGRQTFYYHFADKNELMAWIFLQAIQDVDLLHVDSFADALEHLWQNYTFFKRADEDRSQNAMHAYMVKYYIEYYTSLAKEKLGTDTLDAQLLYSIRFYCYGCHNVTRDWLLNGNAAPARDEAQMILNSMPGPLRKVFLADEDAPREG